MRKKDEFMIKKTLLLAATAGTSDQQQGERDGRDRESSHDSVVSGPTDPGPEHAGSAWIHAQSCAATSGR